VTNPFDANSSQKRDHPIPDGPVHTFPLGKKVGTFTSLRLRDFRLLFLGTLLSNAGLWLQQVALNWLVYDITGSGTVLGTLNVVRSISSLSLSPAAGVVIDRINHRTLMLISAGWLFLISLALGIILLFSEGHVTYLFVFSFLGGISAAFDPTIRQVVVFDLVHRQLIPNAVALIQTGWALMRSFGPAIGGFFILWFGAGGNFLVQAGAYALIAFTVVWIHFPPHKSSGNVGSPLHNIREAIKFVKKERVTRIFMVMGWILSFFIVPNYIALPPIYAKDVFHGGPETLGYLLSAVGGGGIVGGIVAASISRVERRGLIQLTALFLLSLSLIGFALSTKLAIALMFLAFSGFFEMIFLVITQTALQLSIPNNLRGRVISIINLGAAFQPLGNLLAGAGSDLLGGPRMVTVILCSITACIAVGIFLGSKVVRDYRLSPALADNEEKTPTGSYR
jgi:predicted MFS family arabinose efflux permease